MTRVSIAEYEKLIAKPRKRAQPEYKLHCDVADYLNAVLLPEVFWTTFPSGGGGKARGGKLKRMGLVPGVADIMVCWDVYLDDYDITITLWIELKAKAKQSEAQVAFEKRIGRLTRHYYDIARSVDDVAVILNACGVPTREVTKAPKRARRAA